MLIKNYLLLTILTIFILLINEEKVFALNTSVSAGAGGGGGYSLNIGSGSGGGGGYDLNIGSGSGGGGGYDLNIGAGAGGGGNGVDDYFDDYESNNDIYSFYPNNHSNSASGGYNSDNDYDSGAFDSIEDYYDYLENIGVDISNVGNITDDELINYYVVDNATALKSDNSQYVGKLVSNGFNTKFIITNINGTKYYLKKWFKLLTATGQQGWYHFDNDGNMNTGFYNDTDGNTYYFMENGINKGMMVTGQMIINGIFYNFSYGNDGRPQGALIR